MKSLRSNVEMQSSRASMSAKPEWASWRRWSQIMDSAEVPHSRKEMVNSQAKAEGEDH